jgi:hypothetical protein
MTKDLEQMESKLMNHTSELIDRMEFKKMKSFS